MKSIEGSCLLQIIFPRVVGVRDFTEDTERSPIGGGGGKRGGREKRGL